MSNYKRKEVMDYLTRKPTTTQDIELARTRIQTPVPSQQMPVASGEELGTREGFKDGTETLSINPMLDNVNPNTIGGAAIVPAVGITAAAIADRFNISLEDAGRMLKRLYTGPEGLVIGGDRLTEEAKPDIEKFPSGEKPETSLITKMPGETKKDTGFIPPVIDTEIPGLQVDKGTDTSILYSKKIDPAKIEKVAKTYDELKKELKRTPLVREVSDKTDMSYHIVKEYLKKSNRTLAEPSSASDVYFGSLKEVGDVASPTFTKNYGNKWPDETTKNFYENQIIDRFKLAKNSAEFREKKQAGELLTNEQIAEKYNISTPVVKRLNRQIIEDYNLDEKLVKGREKSLQDKSDKRQGAIKIFSDSNFEQKIKGDLGVHLGHMSDLYSRIVKAETQGYAPAEINKALGETIDYVIKSINKSQDKLIEDKPTGWKEKLEEYNVKGMNYAALSKGYKTFEVTDPNTLEKTPINVQYGKIIDPTGIYEGKSIKDIAKETNLIELNKIEKAFSQAARGEKVRNPDLLTEENFKKLKNYKLFEINREAVLKSQSKIPVSEKKEIVKDILNYKKPKYETGGRVKLQDGSNDGYMQEIPSLGFSDPVDILEQRMINEKDTGTILALNEILTEMKKRKLQQETAAAEEKRLQKEKGVRYKEDFPSEAAYFAETGKQLLTNPKYFYGKLGKGIAEGTEFLVGQPLQTLFSQTGKNFEFYQPVAGEKLGINKFIEENKPKSPTTGTLIAGETAEIAGSVLDPFLAYGIVKGATSALKTKAPVVIEETIDPTRRDLLKIGAVITGGAIVYPTAKKLGLLDTSVKVAKTGNAVRIATSGVVDNMPEFFPYLSEFSLARGKVIGQDYMRSGMTEFKRELTIPLEITTGGKKTNVKFEFIHDPAEGNVTAYYTNPLTDEKHSFDFYSGKQGKQAYGIDPQHPGAYEYYTVEVEPPGFDYRYPDKADPYRKNIESYSTSSEGDEVVEALDKWYKGLSKEEKARFENKFITHSEYTDEIPAASYDETENYPIMEFMYPKKKND
jgi:hypothetical protein